MRTTRSLRRASEIDLAPEANKLIADYDTAPADSPRRAHDLAGIDKLARDHVPVALKWEQEQEHNVNAQHGARPSPRHARQSRAQGGASGAAGMLRPS